MLVDLGLQHADRHVIRHQLPLVHVTFGEGAKLRFTLDVGSKNVACAQMHQVVMLHQKRTLGAFSRARRAKQNQVAHR